MKRIIIPNAETYLATIQDEISQTRNIRYFHRLEVVRYVLHGHSPVRPLRFLIILQGPSITGCIDWLVKDSPDYRIPLNRDGRLAYPRLTWNSYVRIWGTRLKSWVMTKISGMGYCFRIIWRKSIPLIWASVAAKVSSMSWALVCKDPVSRQAKRISPSRRFLKKYYQLMQDPNVQLWCEDEVHFQRHGTLTRMWASKGQQPHILTPSCRQKVASWAPST